MDAYHYYSRGMELLESGDFRQSAVALEQAKRLEPDKGSIREALARAYLSTRSYRAAERESQALVDGEPTNHYGHFLLGRALERLGRRMDARRHYRLARCLGSELVPAERAG